MRTLRHIPPDKQIRKAAEALSFVAPMAGALRMDAIRSELERLASATLQRRGQRPGTASGHLLAFASGLLPATARARWREEWLGELHVLVTRRERVAFAGQIALGIGRLAVTLYQPEVIIKRLCRAIFAADVTASGLVIGGWKAVAILTSAVIAADVSTAWILHSDDRTRRLTQLISATKSTPRPSATRDERTAVTSAGASSVGRGSDSAAAAREPAASGDVQAGEAAGR
jgi:hypothetical protein